MVCLAAPLCVGGEDQGLHRAFEQALYKLEASGHGSYLGANAAQRLGLEFSARGATVKAGDSKLDVGLQFAGYGYGGRLLAPAPAELSGAGSRVEYRRGGITEWYVNESRGLEQGFTLAHPPGTAREGESLVLALRVTGGLHPVLSPAGDAVLLQAGRQTVLRYAGLRTRDARGLDVPSRMEAGAHEIRLVVEDRGAVYPLVVDPVVTWNQASELTASDGLAGDWFGASVSVSGKTAVVGVPYKTVNSNTLQGAAYVFVQTGGTWSQQAKLTASDGAGNDNFGGSVSVSGNIAVVGAAGKTVNSNALQGAAYVFVQSGGIWSQQAEITASDGASNDQFGISVSVSGNTAVVGASYKTVNSNGVQGAAYVFVQSGGTWSQQAKLTASDGAANDQFGDSVSIGSGVAVVGAVQKNSYQGAAYVFVQNGVTWSQQAKLTASDGAASDYFGTSVSLSGSTVLVGARSKTVNSNAGQGAAYVFVQSGVAWSQQAKLTASDGAANDQFGDSVSVSGNIAAVGALGKNSSQGAAYVFTQKGGTWNQQSGLTASDGASSDYFGTSVSVSGNTAVAGALMKSVNSNPRQGAAYVFTQLPSATTLSAAPNPAVFGTLVTLTATVTPAAATGTVTFYDGATVLGVAPVLSGVATFPTTLLASGSRSLTALYVGGGAAAYGTSLSPAFGERVNAQPADRYITASGSPFGAGGNPISVAVGDFNGDGKADLAIANFFGGVTVLLGNGSGSFTAAPGSPFATGTSPSSVAVGDFNGDGKPDLAVANQSSGNVTVLLGNGSGGFTQAPGSPVPVGSNPKSVAVGDFNGDGNADLVVANFGNPLNGGGGLTVLLGNGSGGFSQAGGSPLAVGATPVSLAVADFNGDGMADVVIANETANTVTIMLGNGSGGFTPAGGSPYTVDSNPISLALGDFDGDGKVDLAVANYGGNDVSVLLGNGSGGFTQAGASPFPVGTSPYSVVVGDFNGDGKADLATANLGSNTVTVLLGNGSGGFTQETGSPFAAGSAPISLAVADFNGDGKTDMAVADETTNGVTVLLGLAGVNLSLPGQSFTSLGTSNGGLYPSVPVGFAVTPCPTCSGSWTATSNVPWVIITSGGSGTGPGTVRFNVFSNTTTSARTTTIQVTLGSYVASFTITEAASTAPAFNRQVTFLYQQTLGREPDQGGFAFWLGQSQVALGAMTGDFLDSPEGQASDFAVMAMYQAITGAPPAYATYLANLQALRNGTSAQSLFSAILAGIPPASLEATTTRIYQNMLGRAPTPSELTAGVALQPFALFNSLFTGDEFESKGTFKTDHTNSLYVTMLYYLILERAPDQSGFAFWLNVANGGGPGIYYNQNPGIVGSSSTQLLILGNAPNEGFTGSSEFLGGFQ
ncbi:MAG: FG-GAP-like repeat-containing protein [Candidatus Sulfopaludibacter sp.]|nr:FG-GAP-like repeat-containing protein [Candidatus Sulfopaludibacter sp.]